MLATIFCSALLGGLLASAGVYPKENPWHFVLAVGVLLLHDHLLKHVTM